jgi:hypothetical protein
MNFISLADQSDPPSKKPIIPVNKPQNPSWVIKITEF